MKKKKLNWSKIWKEFDKWCTGAERYGGAEWKEQQEKIVELVEKERESEKT